MGLPQLLATCEMLPLACLRLTNLWVTRYYPRYQPKPKLILYLTDAFKNFQILLSPISNLSRKCLYDIMQLPKHVYDPKTHPTPLLTSSPYLLSHLPTVVGHECYQFTPLTY
jgi:hypothetical protein